MVALGIAAGVLGFWLLLVWRVRVEHGWVGVSDYRRLVLRLNGSLVLFSAVLGEVFVPAIEKTTRQMAAFAETFRAIEAEAIRQMVANARAGRPLAYPRDAAFGDREDTLRLHEGVRRYVLELDPGDFASECEKVVAAMESV